MRRLSAREQAVSGTLPRLPNQLGDRGGADAGLWIGAFHIEPRPFYPSLLLLLAANRVRTRQLIWSHLSAVAIFMSAREWPNLGFLVDWVRKVWFVQGVRGTKRPEHHGLPSPDMARRRRSDPHGLLIDAVPVSIS
jgi:hypothetical protein